MRKAILFLCLFPLVISNVTAERPVVREYGVSPDGTSVYLTKGAFVIDRPGYFRGRIEVSRSLDDAYFRLMVIDGVNDAPFDLVGIRFVPPDGEAIRAIIDRESLSYGYGEFSVDRVRDHWQVMGSVPLPRFDLRRFESVVDADIAYARGSETVEIPVGDIVGQEFFRDLSLVLNFFSIGK